MINKITTGFVVQQFDDKGCCTTQEFVAGDQVDWEDENGETIEIENQPCDDDRDQWYYPFEMIQPETLMIRFVHENGKRVAFLQEYAKNENVVLCATKISIKVADILLNSGMSFHNS